MKLQRNRGLTVLMVMGITGLLIPFRYPQGPIYDGCVDIRLDIAWDKQPEICTEEYLAKYAKNLEDHGIEFCRKSYSGMWCVGYKKSELQRIIERGTEWIKQRYSPS